MTTLTTCLWPLLSARSGRSPATTPPLHHLKRLLKHSPAWTLSSCESSPRWYNSLAWTGQLQKSLSAADLTNGSCRQGTASRLHSSGLPRSSQRSIKSFLKCGVSPTRHASTLPYQLLSLRLTALKKRVTLSSLPWKRPSLRNSARPRPLAGR